MIASKIKLKFSSLTIRLKKLKVISSNLSNQIGKSKVISIKSSRLSNVSNNKRIKSPRSWSKWWPSSTKRYWIRISLFKIE